MCFIGSLSIHKFLRLIKPVSDKRKYIAHRKIKKIEKLEKKAADFQALMLCKLVKLGIPTIIIQNVKSNIRNGKIINLIILYNVLI